MMLSMVYLAYTCFITSKGLLPAWSIRITMSCMFVLRVIEASVGGSTFGGHNNYSLGTQVPCSTNLHPGLNPASSATNLLSQAMHHPQSRPNIPNQSAPTGTESTTSQSLIMSNCLPSSQHSLDETFTTDNKSNIGGFSDAQVHPSKNNKGNENHIPTSSIRQGTSWKGNA